MSGYVRYHPMVRDGTGMPMVIVSPVYAESSYQAKLQAADDLRMALRAKCGIATSTRVIDGSLHLCDANGVLLYRLNVRSRRNDFAVRVTHLTFQAFEDLEALVDK